MTMPNKKRFAYGRATPSVWLLVVSIILNLFLVGVLVGAVPGLRMHRHFTLMALDMPRSDHIIDHMVHAMSAQDATAFKNIVEPQLGTLKQNQDQVAQSIKEVSAAFEAEPSDGTALQAAIQHLADARAALNDVVGRIVMDASQKLSAEGRQKIAETKH